MTKLEDIEEAVANLEDEDFAKFRLWFDKLDAKLWDEQIDLDAKNGKLDELAKQALEDHKAGRTREL